jgi:hypothetical protein
MLLQLILLLLLPLLPKPLGETTKKVLLQQQPPALLKKPNISFNAAPIPTSPPQALPETPKLQ